jgi:protein suppressor of PHYA-105 1
LFVSSVTWSPDGRRLIAANSCGAVKVLEIDN